MWDACALMSTTAHVSDTGNGRVAEPARDGDLGVRAGLTP